MKRIFPVSPNGTRDWIREGITCRVGKELLRSLAKSQDACVSERRLVGWNEGKQLLGRPCAVGDDCVPVWLWSV